MKQVCVIVPAFNEAGVIEASLERLLRIFPMQAIYVVSDGSTDQTGRITRRMGINIVTLGHNFEKARALLYLINFFIYPKNINTSFFLTRTASCRQISYTKPSPI
jgi:glycosyltransferase involved in cell wall biosynthesis